MTIEKQAYERHRNLKIAAAEIGMKWQTLYVKLREQGVPVTGDKLRYGSDRDRLAALAEQEFLRLVPESTNENLVRWQSKFDFTVHGYKVDVKASRKRQLSKAYKALSWSFSFKKQSLICDFICCFCMGDGSDIEHVILVPSEFFKGLKTMSVSVDGESKWLDYSIEKEALADFFDGMSKSKKH